MRDVILHDKTRLGDALLEPGKQAIET